MLKRVKMYSIICDGCGCVLDGSGGEVAWNTEEYAEECAEDANWLITGNGKHYCPKCKEWDENLDVFCPKGNN